jgi:hypothetical protein
MKETLDRLRRLPPAEQLIALADLIEDVAQQLRRTGTDTRAQHIVTTETRERRGTPRDDA